MSSNPYAGPPDPINFLRTVSGQDVRDVSNRKRTPGRNADDPPLSPTRYQEAPARERPPPGQAWPYRVSSRAVFVSFLDLQKPPLSFQIKNARHSLESHFPVSFIYRKIYHLLDPLYFMVREQ